MTLGRIKAVIAFALPLLAACAGHSVDLDSPSSLPPLVDAGPGTELVLNRREIPIMSDLLSDDQRLYWMDYDGNVQGCQKDSCLSTVLTYAHSGSKYAGPSTDFAIGGEHLYWVALDGTIYSCPRSGCTGEPTRIFRDGRLVYGGTSRAMIADENNVYWPGSSTFYYCPSIGCSSIPESLQTNSSGDLALISGGTVYFTAISATEDSFESVPTDGSTAAITYAEEPLSFLFAVQGTDLYWLNSNSQVSTCSMMDCEHTKRVVLPGTGERQRGNFVLRNGVLYWQGETPYDGPISFCRLADCPASVGTELVSGTVSSFTLDDHYLYWTAGDTPGFATSVSRMPVPAP